MPRCSSPRRWQSEIGGDLAEALITADQRPEAGIRAQRERVAALLQKSGPPADHPAGSRIWRVLAEWLVRRSVWIIGGDGWAYDIGYGGLDHILALSYDVNILVLDTEVYSNTGGQTSKATPVGAVAQAFRPAARPRPRRTWPASPRITATFTWPPWPTAPRMCIPSRPSTKPKAYAGPSLIVAYSPCIAHGVDMLYNQRQQDMAVKSGHWPLFRHDPRVEEPPAANPFKLDSAAAESAHARLSWTAKRALRCWPGFTRK
jgi:pyruvate-ferredoxin/flavodoxin oxidoreductase